MIRQLILTTALFVVTGCMSTMPPLGSSKVERGFNTQVGTDGRILLANTDTTGLTDHTSSGMPAFLTGNLSVGIRERVELSGGAMFRPLGLSGHLNAKLHIFHKGDENHYFRNISTAAFAGSQAGFLILGDWYGDYEFHSGVIVSTFAKGPQSGMTTELPLYLYYSKDYHSSDDDFSYSHSMNRDAINIGTGLLWSVSPDKELVTFSMRGVYRIPIKYRYYETIEDERNMYRTSRSTSGGHEFNFSLAAQFHIGKRRRRRRAGTL